MERQDHHGMQEAARDAFGEMIDVQLVTRQNINRLDPAGWSALHYAVLMEDYLMTLHLILSEADVNIRMYGDGPAPIHLVAETGNLDRMKILWYAGADINSHTTDTEGLAPIHIATENDHVHVVQWLLEVGVPVDIPSLAGRTPLLHAADRDAVGVVQVLLEAGANVNFVSDDSYGLTALHIAVKNLNEEIVIMLVCGGADVSILCAYDQASPVHWATQMVSLNILGVLTENAIEATKPTGDGESNYPIHYAARSGNMEIFTFLVAIRRIPVSVYNNAGYTPLHIAAMFGKCKVVKYIADTGIIYIDVGSRVNNSTPLHVSLLYDKGDVADILVVSGASVNCLTLDTRYSPMHYAILCNSVEYLEMLYESEGDLNIHHRAYNIEPLLVTAAKCNSYNVANFLLEHDVSVDTVADNGHTALHHAVRLRSRRLIRLFLNRGASVNIQGHDGQTVLHFLSEICIRDILQIFVGRSMTLIILDNGGMNPVHLAAQNGNYAFLQMFAQDVALWYTRTANENMDYPIHLAALGGYVNIVVLFLREMDADVQNALGRTVLFNAAVKGSENLVRLLLQRGASVNGSQQSRDGVTPLHAAISCKSNKVVKLLLEHHADMNVRAFPEQYTPLHWAISTNDEESVKRLLRWRADREIRTSNGYNAVDLARALGRWNMVEYIYHGDRL